MPNGSTENSYGERLRNLRQKCRLTLAEVAGAAGVSPQYISHYEHGRRQLSLGRFFDLVGLIVTAYYREHGKVEEHIKEINTDVNQRTASARDSAAG